MYNQTLPFIHVHFVSRDLPIAGSLPSFDQNTKGLKSTNSETSFHHVYCTYTADTLNKQLLFADVHSCCYECLTFICSIRRANAADFISVRFVGSSDL